MKLIFSKTVNHEDELSEIAGRVIAYLPNKKSILLLEGPVSAGKTTFTRYLCSRFGIKLAQSPTYAIHNAYTNAIVSIDHFDLYRLENEEQIESSGFFDLLVNKSDYKLVEWADRISIELYPVDMEIFKIVFTIVSDKKRKIDFYALSFASSSSSD